MFVDLQYVTIFVKRKECPVSEKNRILFYCFVAFFLSSKDGAIQIQNQSDTQFSSKTPFFITKYVIVLERLFPYIRDN